MKETAVKLWKQSKFLTVCLILVTLIVLLMPLHAFLSTWLGTAIGPLWAFKSWKEIVIGLLSLGGFIWVLINGERRHRILRDKFVLLVGAYVVLTLIVTWAQHAHLSSSALAAGLGMNLRFPLIFLIAYLTASELALPYGTLRHYALHGLMWVGAALAVLGILQVTIVPPTFLEQFGYDKATTIAPYVLIDDNPSALRAFATLRGPNDFAAFLIVPILISFLLGVMQKRRYIAPGVIMLAALVLSSSRSAWVGTLVAVGVMLLVVFGRHVLKNKKAILAITAGFVVGLAVVVASFSIPQLRLAVFHSSPGDSSLTEGSTDNHWKAGWDGVKRVVAAPLGNGAGSAGPASYYGDTPRISENYYIQIAEEVGIIGLGIFLGFIGLVFARLYAARPDTLAVVLFSAGIGLLVVGLWLHVWSDDPLGLTFFALAGMVVGATAKKH